MIDSLRPCCIRRGRGLYVACVAIGSLFMANRLVAAGPQESDDRVRQREQLLTQTKALRKESKSAEAIASLQKALSISREMHGDLHDDTRSDLAALAEVYEATEEFSSARSSRRQILESCTKEFAAGHWQIADAQRALDHTARLEQMAREQRRLLMRADQLMTRVQEMLAAGKAREALQPALEAVDLRQRILGANHWVTGSSVSWLGSVYSALEDRVKAEEACRGALANRKEQLGEDHPAYASALDNLANILDDRGDLDSAEPLRLRALDVRRKALGPSHADVAVSLHNLAFLYHQRREFEKAEALFKESLEIKRNLTGENDRSYAETLGGLARLNFDKREYALAEKLYRQALEIQKRLLGEKHVMYGQCLNNLALVYEAVGDYARAEPCYRQAMQIVGESLGEEHSWYAVALGNLAHLYHRAGDFEKARQLLVQQAQLLEKFGVERRNQLAHCLKSLATVNADMGDLEGAEKTCRQSLDIARQAWGEKDLNYLKTLESLSELLARRQNYPHATETLQQAVEATKEAVGIEHPRYRAGLEQWLVMLDRAADAAESQREFAVARQYRKRAVSLQEQFHGVDHWKAAEARLSLQEIDRLEGVDAAGSAELAKASELMERVVKLSRQVQPEPAIPLAEQALAIRHSVLGADCQPTLYCMDWLGTVLSESQQYERAENVFNEALVTCRDLLGAGHPSFAKVLSNIAFAQSKRKQLEQCIGTYREVLQLRKQFLANDHPEYVTSVNNLAVVLGELGDQQLKREEFAAARATWTEVFEMRKKVWGDTHWHTTNARLSVAHVDVVEKLGRAERQQLQESVELNKKILELYGSNRSSEALPLAKQLLEDRQRLVGDEHYLTAQCWNSLGLVYRELGDFKAAESSRRRAVEMSERLYGRMHPSYATDLHNLGGLYQTLGDLGKAEECYREAFAIRRQILGDNDESCASSLNDLALNCGNRGDYAQEEFLLRQSVALHKRLKGSRHPAYAVSLGNLAVTYNTRGDSKTAEPLLQEAAEIFQKAGRERSTNYAWILRGLADLYSGQQQFAKAQPLYEQAVDIYSNTVGKQSSQAIGATAALAQMHLNAGSVERAQPLIEETLEATKDLLGEGHPEFADRLQSLAWISATKGDYKQAEVLHRRVVEIRKHSFGAEHARYADALRHLGRVYRETKDYARAEPLYRQSLEILRKAVGERHPDYSELLDEAADLYLSMDDAQQARRLREQALEITREVLGEKHPEYATVLANLGLVHDHLGNGDRAEECYRRALAIHKEIDDPTQGNHYILLMNLGSLCSRRGNFAAAEPLLLEAAALSKLAKGERHPRHANTIYHLGWLSYLKSDYSAAELWLNKAMDIYRAALGERSSDWSKCMHALAHVHVGQGDYERASAVALRALEIQQQLNEQTAAVQSERQQLASALELRRRIDFYLSCALRSTTSSDIAYQQVLNCKGSVTSRQSEVRRLRRSLQAEGQAEASQAFEQLLKATAKLAALHRSASSSNADNLAAALTDASNEVERLEGIVASRSATYRAQTAGYISSPSGVRAVLPAGAVLVDLLDYWNFDSNRASERNDIWQHHDGSQRRVLAFVSRAGQSAVTFVDLGPTEYIAAKIQEWRETYGGKTKNGKDPGAELRRLLWEPLSVACQGAALVLISPDGELARLAWTALPGEKPNTYLIEDVPLSLVSVPSQLTTILASAPSVAKDPSLMLVGDVRFDGLAGVSQGTEVTFSASRGTGDGKEAKWLELPGTQAEADAVRKLFQGSFAGARVVTLRSDEATEAAVRRSATHAQFLHFATHGYFATAQQAVGTSERAGEPTSTLETVVGFHPGLLSGLVLAGANRPTDYDHDDGILTALEVEALDLSDVELATLSACETGLGQNAAGEGLLGLQRAFQTAGARSVVAGLWKVPDRTTQVLMERFYDNLWRRRLSKLEALRDAQIWMLHQDPKHSEALRGLDVLPVEPTHAGAGLPPYYWAAFILSGDWR